MAPCFTTCSLFPTTMAARAEATTQHFASKIFFYEETRSQANGTTSTIARCRGWAKNPTLSRRTLTFSFTEGKICDLLFYRLVICSWLICDLEVEGNYINKIMKYQSLPKNISSTSKQSMKESGEPVWSSFIRPIDDSMPEHSFQCECEMCNIYEYKKYIPVNSGSSTLSINKLSRSTTK